ncbi:MAG: hypothetical protein LQ346_004514, partial [Caloplaca aetnensis]
MYGVYRPDDNLPLVLPSVRLAKQRLFDDPTWNHEYPPSHLGTAGFREETAKLIFGEGAEVVREGR